MPTDARDAWLGEKAEVQMVQKRKLGPHVPVLALSRQEDPGRQTGSQQQ